MASPKRPSATVAACLVVACLAGGCTQSPFRAPAPVSAPSLTAAPIAATPFAPLAPPSPSYVDSDPRRLEAGLARSREEAMVMQDEIAALREQLASTSAQLVQARAAGPGASPAPSSAAPPGTMTPVAMQSAMGTLTLAGVERRVDGGVVRLEISADKLFEPGGANLLPAGTALLTQVSDEVERVFPGHFLGIEGHTDTEPLQNASWGSQHQLSVARASAVFDFLTTRTSLRQGQLFLVAHGPNHPVVSNATAAGRARNRRIELVIYPERSGADAAPVGHPAAATAGGG